MLEPQVSTVDADIVHTDFRFWGIKLQARKMFEGLSVFVNEWGFVLDFACIGTDVLFPIRCSVTVTMWSFFEL